MPRKKLEALQLDRLQKTVQRAYNNVPHYRNKLDQAGITPEDIKTLEDLQKLPFTVKQDMRNNYPFGLFAVPQDDIVRLHASSGTTGKPTVVGYTQNDLVTWSDLMARAFAMAGGTHRDVVQNAYGYGLFTGGMGVHYGAGAPGCDCSAHFRRQYCPPVNAYAGLRYHYTNLHTLLRFISW